MCPYIIILVRGAIASRHSLWNYGLISGLGCLKTLMLQFCIPSSPFPFSWVFSWAISSTQVEEAGRFPIYGHIVYKVYILLISTVNMFSF